MIILLKWYLDKSAWINKELSMFSLSFSGLSEKNYFFFLDYKVYNKKEVFKFRENSHKKNLSASFIWIDTHAQDILLAASSSEKYTKSQVSWNVKSWKSLSDRKHTGYLFSIWFVCRYKKEFSEYLYLPKTLCIATVLNRLEYNIK